MRTLTLFALLYARCAFSQTGFSQLPRLTSDYDPAGKDPIQNSSNGGVAVPTAAPNNATITSSVCTGCLLKALNPYTIPDPTTFSDSNHTTVVTTATVIRSTTFFEPSTPVASEVNYYTKTIQTTLVVPNNDTVFHTLSTSVYTYSGVTLTWPTQYVLYSDFATGDLCSASPTHVPLPEATDLAKLIYPLVDGSALPLPLVEYLETLPEFDGVDLTNCSSLAQSKQLARRHFGYIPFPFGPRKDALPMDRRGANSTTTAGLQPSPPPVNNGKQIPPGQISSGQSSFSRTSVPRMSSNSATSSSSTSSSKPSLSSRSESLARPSVPPVKVKPSTLRTAISSFTPSTPASVMQASSKLNNTSGISLSHSSVVSASRPPHISLSHPFASSLSVHINTAPRTRPHLPLSTGPGSNAPSHNETGPHKPHSPGQPHHFNATKSHHHANGTEAGCHPCTALLSKTHSVADGRPTLKTLQTTKTNGVGPAENLTPTGAAGPESSEKSKPGPSPPPVYHTSVAVLTQVTQDASTTVKAPGTVSHPAPIPTTHGNPLGNGGGNTPNAAAGGGGGGGQQEAPSPQTVNPNQGLAQILPSIIESAAQNQAAAAPVADPANSQSGNDGGGDTVDQQSAGGADGANNQGESSNNDATGNFHDSGPGGSQNDDNNDSEDHSGSTQGGTSGINNPGSSGTEGSQPDSHTVNSGSGNQQGGNGQGMGQAVANIVGKPPNSAANNPAAQSVEIGGTPVAVRPVPASPGTSNNAFSGGPNANSGSSDKSDEVSGSGNGNGGPSGGASPDDTNAASPANTGNGVVVGSQTIHPGQVATFNNVPVSVVPKELALVVDGSNTVNLQGGVPQTINVKGSSIVAIPARTSGLGGGTSGVVIDGQAVQPGTTATVNGVPVVLGTGSSGSSLILGGTSTVGLQNLPSSMNVGGSRVPVAAISNPGSGLDTTSTPASQMRDDVVVGTQTLAQDQVTTIKGQHVSVSNGNLIIGGSRTVQIQQPTEPPTIRIGDSTITAKPNGAFIFGDRTLSLGGPPLTVSGSNLSLGPSGVLVINGRTSTLAGFSSAPSNTPVLTIGGKQFTASVTGTSTQFDLPQHLTLTQGGIVTVSGTTVSLPLTSSGIVVVNGHTSSLGFSAPSVTQVPVLTIGNRQITASVSDGITEFVLAGQRTLKPGEQITESDTTVKFPTAGAQAGSVVVVNGKTSVLGRAYVTPAPVLTINGHKITASMESAQTEFDIGPNQTLRRGGALTISGTTYQYHATGIGSIIVINGHSSVLGTALVSAAPPLIFERTTYQPTIFGTSTYYVIDGSTLRPGSVITVHGTRLSLGNNESIFVVGDKTSTIKGLASASATPTRVSTGGLGNAINSGLNGNNAGASATSSKHSTGTRLVFGRNDFLFLFSFVVAFWLFLA